MSTSNMPTSTANWHWKNKNVTPWAKTWFEQELVTVSHSEGGSEVKITSVNEVDGDCELGQRKSKLITIYDCKVVLSWTGENKDGSKAEGKLTIPEVSHEQSDGLSDYVYDWTLKTSSTPEVDALYALAKSKLPPSLLSDSPHSARLCSTHTGKTYNSLSKPVPAKEVSKGITNSAVVTVDASFMASAAELYEFLTDEKRYLLGRGTKLSLFGGGVTGKYIELQKPNKIVSTWRLNSPSWPSDHDGKLTITLDQQTDSTKVEFKLSGVPLGQEDETRKNLEGYYIGGFQSIGYVRVTPTVVSSSARPHVRPSPKKPKLHHGLYPAFLLYSPCLPLLVPAIFDLYIPFYNLLLTIAFITFSTRLAASL
ncbi:Activator of Hsp90 ATPase, N-terminal [Rhizoctonia solani]|uniref:Activator of Hsp90 ATPase, N-terminal n=1 Tax=Rhizoctonia solani TaxID=456999 RepID=A0A8H7IKU2_9AGAM|nr:Activator of Hsp90 ATPase, N-terminal [Rhizoctonia solani]